MNGFLAIFAGYVFLWALGSGLAWWTAKKLAYAENFIEDNDAPTGRSRSGSDMDRSFH